jgi:hypothetical protein
LLPRREDRWQCGGNFACFVLLYVALLASRKLLGRAVESLLSLCWWSFFLRATRGVDQIGV